MANRSNFRQSEVDFVSVRVDFGTLYSIFGLWVWIPGSGSRFCLRFDYRPLGVNYLLPGIDLRPLGSKFGSLGVVL